VSEAGERGGPEPGASGEEALELRASERGVARSYRPGAWFGIFGDHATVLLPPSEKARVGRLWELVDEGAGFDEVLDALISSGLRELPGFVLVSESEADTKVVIRGAARATFTTGSEQVGLEGSSATTWVERSLADVAAMVVEVGDGETGTEDLRITNGLVRVGRVDAPAAEDEAPPGDEPAPDAPADEPADEPADDLPDTAAHAVVTDADEPPPPIPVPEPPGPALPAGPAPASSDHDGMTRTGTQDPALPSPQPGIPGQPPAPSITRPVARLVFSSGETVEVDRSTLIGRAPEARRFPASDQPRLVTVPSPHQEISSTHLEIRPGSGADHGSAVVTDLGSTNGSVLVQPGLPPEDLQPGIAVQLLPGALIDLGDGLTIQVLDP
jgi:hypothetical protein